MRRRRGYPLRIRVAAVLLLALVVWLLAACGEPVVGPVVGRNHHDASTWIYMQPVYSTRCSGNPMVCTQYQSGMVPVTQYTPERWTLVVADENDEGKHREVTVTQAVWSDPPARWEETS